MRTRIAASLIAVALGGCQTDANSHWEQIAPGPSYDYANAQCSIMASSVDQGVVAWGTPGYVAGAQIGNALGNAIRESQFMTNCMTMQGWKRIPNAQKSSAASAPTLTADQRTTAVNLLMIGIVADRCGINLSSVGREGVKEARRVATAQMRSEAKDHADEKMNGPIASMGKAAYCKKVRTIVAENKL